MRTRFAFVCVSWCLIALALGCHSEEAGAKEDQRPAKSVVECRWASGKIKVDGKTDEIAWENAQVIDGFQVFWQNRKPRTSTKARLLWDDEHLYFTADMEDSD